MKQRKALLEGNKSCSWTLGQNGISSWFSCYTATRNNSRNNKCRHAVTSLKAKLNTKNQLGECIVYQQARDQAEVLIKAFTDLQGEVIGLFECKQVDGSEI